MLIKKWLIDWLIDWLLSAVSVCVQHSVVSRSRAQDAGHPPDTSPAFDHRQQGTVHIRPAAKHSRQRRAVVGGPGLQLPGTAVGQLAGRVLKRRRPPAEQRHHNTTQDNRRYQTPPPCFAVLPRGGSASSRCRVKSCWSVLSHFLSVRYDKQCCCSRVLVLQNGLPYTTDDTTVAGWATWPKCRHWLPATVLCGAVMRHRSPWRRSRAPACFSSVASSSNSNRNRISWCRPPASLGSERENKLSSVKDRGQTDRVILANHWPNLDFH